jgi:hypothetical protein
MKLLALAAALVVGPVALSAQDKKDPETIRITAYYENATLEDILEGIQSISGIPIEIDDAALKKVDLKAATSFKVQDVTLASGVKLLVGPLGLEAKVVDKKKLLITVPKAK